MSQPAIEQLSDDYCRGDISLSDFEQQASELARERFSVAAPAPSEVPDLETRLLAACKRLTVKSPDSQPGLKPWKPALPTSKPANRMESTMSHDDSTKSLQGRRDDLNAAAVAIHEHDRRFSKVALAFAEGYVSPERFGEAVRRYEAEAADVQSRFIATGEAFARDVPCPEPDSLPDSAESVLTLRAIAARLDALATGQLVMTRMLAAHSATITRLTAAHLGETEAIVKLADAVSEPEEDPDDPFGVGHLLCDEDDE